MLEELAHLVGRNRLGDERLADAAHEDERQRAALDLLVLGHRVEDGVGARLEPVDLRDARRQAAGGQVRLDPRDIGGRAEPEVVREPEGACQADGDALAVHEARAVIVREALEGVAERVAEVEQRPLAVLALVAHHDASLAGAGLGDRLVAGRAKFAFVILSVAIGVAALTGVRGFSSAFRATLLLRARSIMAADLAARTNIPLTPYQQTTLKELISNGASETTVTESLSMASSATSLDPLLVSLKAIDPGKYPFYGDVVLDPAMPLTKALGDSTVAVGEDLLLRLHLKVGDSIKLGTQVFRIAAAVVDEPDRLSGSFAAGPRVLLTQTALDSTGLVSPAARVSRRYLFKLPAAKPGQALSDDAVAALKTKVESLLPEAQVSDYREANPALTRALDGATGLLSLMSLVALVLGAVGVAMAMRAHLQQRLDSIAIMKSLGAGSSQIMKIYLLQTVLLGIAGGVLGVLLGLGVQLAFPLFLAKLLHLSPSFQINSHAIAMGLIAGLLTTLLFTVPTLLSVRNIRPILILRRAVDSGDGTFFERLSRNLSSYLLQLLAGVVIVGALVALAARVSDSSKVGLVFGGGLIVALVLLYLTAKLLMYALRLFLGATRLHLPSSLRHGLANLYRPGNPSAALLAALGLGVNSLLRYVDFVEIMCPVFSTRALRVCRGSFRDSVSGFGLDHLWPALLGGARSRIAIIDSVGVIHTRPLGRNYVVQTAIDEEAALLAAYRLNRVRMKPLQVEA